MLLAETPPVSSMELEKRFWTRTLGEKLLACIPEKKLIQYWSHHGTASSGQRSPRLQVQLLDWANEDSMVQDWIVTEWRQNHQGLVESLDQMLLERFSESTMAEVSRYSLDQVIGKDAERSSSDLPSRRSSCSIWRT
jgi:hypothetical protein